MRQWQLSVALDPDSEQPLFLQLANAIADAEIASEVYSTAGDYDLLCKFYVEDSTDIGHFVNEKVQVIPGIQDTRTIITFKAFG